MTLVKVEKVDEITPGTYLVEGDSQMWEVVSVGTKPGLSLKAQLRDVAHPDRPPVVYSVAAILKQEMNRVVREEVAA